MSDTKRVWRIVMAWYDNWPPTLVATWWWKESNSRFYRFRLRNGGEVRYRFTDRELAEMDKELLE